MCSDPRCIAPPAAGDGPDAAGPNICTGPGVVSVGDPLCSRRVVPAGVAAGLLLVLLVALTVGEVRSLAAGRRRAGGGIAQEGTGAALLPE